MRGREIIFEVKRTNIPTVLKVGFSAESEEDDILARDKADKLRLILGETLPKHCVISGLRKRSWYEYMIGCAPEEKEIEETEKTINEKARKIIRI